MREKLYYLVALLPLFLLACAGTDGSAIASAVGPVLREIIEPFAERAIVELIPQVMPETKPDGFDWTPLVQSAGVSLAAVFGLNAHRNKTRAKVLNGDKASA